MRNVRYLALFVPVALLTFLIGVFISRITLTLSHQEPSDEWQEALESSDTVEVLSALMWFSGSHSDIDPGTEGTKFLTVRQRASVQKRLAELSESNNFWIKSVAATIMANRPTD